MRSAPLLILLVVAALAAPGAVRAQSDPACSDAETPRVAVRFEGDAWTERFREAVLAELHAALAAQDMAACASDGLTAGEPVAEIHLRTTELPRVAVVIEVRDDVTDKRVARDLDLAVFPEDGRALALAVASDELLRASWMELAMSDAPEPARPPPPAVRRTVETEVERSRPSVTTLALRGAAFVYSAGEVHLGGDLLVVHRFAPVASFELSVGARRGLREESANGTIRSSALGGGAELRLHPWTGDTTAGLSTGLLAQQVVFRPDADPGAIASTDDGLLLEAVLGLFVEHRLGEVLLLHGSVGLGIPLLGVAATDAGERVTAAAGVAGYARLGLGVQL